MEPIITVKGISKKYNITHQRGGYVALRDVITNAFKNPFTFLKRKAKEITGLEKKEVFWALKDINFEVQKGEVIGIIGRNGAGKSTLLKILSQITPPTEGEIKINGTVGSLLEVGTGFHPELTGRENIFLNGAILGMKKKEIVKKFDEIVKFADIEKFLDTPVKYYSSGMYVRLAFSVAAHMDTDILIIDEVLAVGDAEFQKKCLGKMEDITQKEGRTILFVSHDLNTITNICQKVIVLENGKLVEMDTTKNAIISYQNRSTNQKKIPLIITPTQENIIFRDFLINNIPSEKDIEIISGEPLAIDCTAINNSNSEKSINIGYGILKKIDNALIIFTHAELEGFNFEIKKISKIKMLLNMPKLSPGDYFVEFHAWINGQLIITKKEIGYFTISTVKTKKGQFTLSTFPSTILVDSQWEITKT